MNGILKALQDKYGDIKEVYETKDDLEAARMTQTGKWAIILGCIQEERVNWVLVRYR